MKIRKLIRKIVVSLVAANGDCTHCRHFIYHQPSRSHRSVFLAEANQQIATPIEVAKIDVSLLRNFPHISLVFHDVTVSESYQADPVCWGMPKQ
jgi:7-cyano-7-deazaguanine synthase in queuosine biosynthesis